MNRMSSLAELLLQSPKLTLSVAESLTCGVLQARIGSISGASAYFRGGCTAYDLEAKISLLGVTPDHARSVDCVSRQVAEEMAVGACSLFKSDIAIATTGYAEPNPAKDVAQAFAWWAIAHRLAPGRREVDSGRVILPGRTRVEVQEAVTTEVLQQLTNYLLKFRQETSRR